MSDPEFSIFFDLIWDLNIIWNWHSSSVQNVKATSGNQYHPVVTVGFADRRLGPSYFVAQIPPNELIWRTVEAQIVSMVVVRATNERETQWHTAGRSQYKDGICD